MNARGFATLLLVVLAVALGLTAPSASAAIGNYQNSFTVSTSPSFIQVPFALAVDPTDQAVYVAANGLSYNRGTLYRVSANNPTSSWHRTASEAILPANLHCFPQTADFYGESDLEALAIFPNADGSLTFWNQPHYWNEGNGTGCNSVRRYGFLNLDSWGTYTSSLGERGYDWDGYNYTFVSNGLFTSPTELDPEQAQMLDVARNSTTGQYYQLWSNFAGDPTTVEVLVRNADGAITDSFHPSLSSLNLRPHIAVNSTTGAVYISSTDQSGSGSLHTGQPTLTKYTPGSWTATPLALSTASLPPAQSYPGYGTYGYFVTGLAVDSTNNRVYALLDNGGKQYDGSFYGDFSNAIGAVAEWQNDLPAGILNGNNTPAESLAGTETNGIAVDPVDGSLYVSDPGNRVVEHFNPVVVPTVGSGNATPVVPHVETISGFVNPSGVAVNSCVIQYGPTKSYGNSAPCDQTATSLGSGSSDVEVTKTLNNLTAGATYHYRVVGSNANGSQAGFDTTFTVASPSAPQVVEPLSADASSSPVTLHANINPHYGDTSYYFVYGLTSSYGSQTATAQVPVSDNNLQDVSAQITGPLTPGATYHYGVVASSNPGGSTTSNDFTFIAPANTPTISNVASGNPGQNSNQLYGTVNPGGSSTSCQFELVDDADYQPLGLNPYTLGVAVPANPNPLTGNGSNGVSGLATNLQPNTLYHYHLACVNGVGADDSGDFTFLTAALPPVVSGLTVTDIDMTTVTLHAQLIRNSDPVTYYWNYGVNSTYGLRSPNATASSDGLVTYQLTGLAPGTSYHFNLVANGLGFATTWSQDATFTTATATSTPIEQPPGLSAPEVFFYSGPRPQSAEQQAVFIFSGSSSVTHYQCQIDANGWMPCSSGFNTTVVPGDHEYQLRGLTDSGAASNIYTYYWTVYLPQTCVVKTARARIVVSGSNRHLHLATNYTTYSPAKNVTSIFYAKLKGGKRAALGQSVSNFKRAGVSRVVKAVDKATWKQVKQAKSFVVQLKVPGARSSCNQYLTKTLTIKKVFGGEPVWFQSDALFSPKRLKP